MSAHPVLFVNLLHKAFFLQIVLFCITKYSYPLPVITLNSFVLLDVSAYINLAKLHYLKKRLGGKLCRNSTQVMYCICNVLQLSFFLLVFRSEGDTKRIANEAV